MLSKIVLFSSVVNSWQVQLFSLCLNLELKIPKIEIANLYFTQKSRLAISILEKTRGFEIGNNL